MGQGEGAAPRSLTFTTGWTFVIEGASWLGLLSPLAPRQTPRYTIFLLSPANLGGVRGELVFHPEAAFPLARQLQSGGAPIGELFSFVSSLYFRGKVAYATAFGQPPPGLAGALVITPGEGLRLLDELVTFDRLRGWSTIEIHARNPRFTDPLMEHAAALLRAHGATTRFVLLGSVASNKYVTPLVRVFSGRLLFPSDFVGRGDMSRGGLLLRAARDGRELAYAPIEGTTRRGSRPPRLAPQRRS
jgi:hypothetical protein